MALRKEFGAVLAELASGLDEKEILWAVIGSANLALQGLDVKPNDLDISTTISGVRLFEEIFGEYVTEPAHEARFEDALKCRLRAKMQGVEIDIVGSDSDVYNRHLEAGHVVFVKVNGVPVPCFTLEAELAGYSELGRHEKARLVRDFLASRL